MKHSFHKVKAYNFTWEVREIILKFSVNNIIKLLCNKEVKYELMIPKSKYRSLKTTTTTTDLLLRH